MNQIEFNELKERLNRFYLHQQSERTHFLVRTLRKREICVAATKGTLRSYGFREKEINEAVKRQLLTEEWILKAGTRVCGFAYNKKIEVERETLLDKASSFLKNLRRAFTIK